MGKKTETFYATGTHPRAGVHIFLNVVPEKSTLLSFITMRLSGSGRPSPDEADDDDDSVWRLVQRRKQITERIIGRQCISASQQARQLISYFVIVGTKYWQPAGASERARGRGQRAKLLFAPTFPLKAIFQNKRDKSAKKKTTPLILTALLSATSPLIDFQH